MKVSSEQHKEKKKKTKVLNRRFVKVILQGDAKVGKSQFHNVYMNDAFSYAYRPTLGADYVGKSLSLTRLMAMIEKGLTYHHYETERKQKRARKRKLKQQQASQHDKDKDKDKEKMNEESKLQSTTQRRYGEAGDDEDEEHEDHEEDESSEDEYEDGDTVIDLQVWDTAGQERFSLLTTSFIRGAHIVIFMYDITKRASFDNVSRVWIPQFQSNCAQDPHSVMAFLIGNKLDKCQKHAEKRQVTVAMTEQLCAKYNGWIRECYEVSCTKRDDVYGALEQILALYLSNAHKEEENEDGEKSEEEEDSPYYVSKAHATMMNTEKLETDPLIAK